MIEHWTIHREVVDSNPACALLKKQGLLHLSTGMLVVVPSAETDSAPVISKNFHSRERKQTAWESFTPKKHTGRGVHPFSEHSFSTGQLLLPPIVVHVCGS